MGTPSGLSPQEPAAEARALRRGTRRESDVEGERPPTLSPHGKALRSRPESQEGHNNEDEGKQDTMTDTDLRTAEDLTAEEVAEIRLRKKNRVPVGHVARSLRVSAFTVLQVERGEARRDVAFRLPLPPDPRALAPEDQFFLATAAAKEERKKLRAASSPSGPKPEKWTRGPLATTPKEFREMKTK